MCILQQLAAEIGILETDLQVCLYSFCIFFHLIGSCFAIGCLMSHSDISATITVFISDEVEGGGAGLFSSCGNESPLCESTVQTSESTGKTRQQEGVSGR